jgi:CRP/FNR family transcriptional regulator, cyclic AMP receptor protein
MLFEEKVRLLSQVYLLEPLSAQEIAWLGQRTPDIRLDHGRILYTPLHIGRTLYLLLEGRIYLYKIVGSRQQTLEVMGSGEMFGEAVLAGRSQGSYAQALESAWIAIVSLDTLRELTQRNPQVGLKMAELLAARLHHYGNQMADIALKEVAGRLTSLLLYLCESEGIVSSDGYRIPTRYTHEQLGNMIGAQRTAVTRALSRLQDEEIVELRRRIIYVRDIEALKANAAKP